MFGHSRGGAATIDTMFHDARIRAGVSLDTGSILFGDDVTPPSEVATAGLDRPLGLMCSLDVPCGSPHLVDFVSRLRGPHKEKDLNILHNGYTDFVVFNAQAARVDPALAANLEVRGSLADRHGRRPPGRPGSAGGAARLRRNVPRSPPRQRLG